MLDIFNAVESLDNGQLFSFMKPGSGLSGRQSHSLCAGWPFGADSECLEKELQSITLASIIEDAETQIANDEAAANADCSALV